MQQSQISFLLLAASPIHFNAVVSYTTIVYILQLFPSWFHPVPNKLLSLFCFCAFCRCIVQNLSVGGASVSVLQSSGPPHNFQKLNFRVGNEH